MINGGQRIATAKGVMLADPNSIGNAPESAAESLFDPCYWAARGEMAAVTGGRGSAWFVGTAANPWVLRHYRRGGLIARISEDRYVWAGEQRVRAFAEWRLLEILSRRGLPVPKPVAAWYGRERMTYRCDLITQRIVACAQAFERDAGIGGAGAELVASHRRGGGAPACERRGSCGFERTEYFARHPRGRQRHRLRPRAFARTGRLGHGELAAPAPLTHEDIARPAARPVRPRRVGEFSGRLSGGRRLGGCPMNVVYSWLIRCAAPFAFAVVLWRGLRDRSYWQGLTTSDSVTGRTLPSPCIWLHAVSLGEMSAAAPLLRALRSRYPQVSLAITTATPAGRARALALFGDSAEVRYLPYDTPGSVRRFLARIRPRVAIIMETELWPNLFKQCEQRGVPVFLASARLSARSVVRYRRFGALFGGVFTENVLIAAQSADDAARFQSNRSAPRRPGSGG